MAAFFLISKIRIILTPYSSVSPVTALLAFTTCAQGVLSIGENDCYQTVRQKNWDLRRDCVYSRGCVCVCVCVCVLKLATLTVNSTHLHTHLTFSPAFSWTYHAIVSLLFSLSLSLSLFLTVILGMLLHATFLSQAITARRSQISAYPVTLKRVLVIYVQIWKIIVKADMFLKIINTLNLSSRCLVPSSSSLFLLWIFSLYLY